MTKTLAQIQDIAEKLIYDDTRRNQAFEAYEEIYHNGWDLPPLIRNLPWIRKVISSDPHDAIKTGDRILSTLPVSIKMQPYAPGEQNKTRVNQIEKNLAWQLKGANRRRAKSVESESSRSALLYDAIAAQVIDLEWQIKQKEAIGASAQREKAMRRYGRFVIKVYNPRSIHVRYSIMMPEAVLVRELREAQDVIDEWGSMAANETLQALATTKGFSKVWYFDYWDYDTRAVWCVPGNPQDEDIGKLTSGAMVSTHAESMVIVQPGPHGLPFLPWVAEMGGSVLESDPLHRHQPLLYAIYTTGVWDTQNAIETLMVSETIAHSGSPRLKEEGPNPQESSVDYGSPERIAKVPPGNVLSQLAPPQIDRALAEIDAMFAAKIDKSTVSRILMGGDLPSGIAFATLNLATQTSVGVLKPAKDLTEKALAEIFTLMLLWVEFTKVPLYAFSTDKEDAGVETVIQPDEIEPEAIYIECEMHPDTPTDRQQKINAAAMAVQQLRMPLEMALEEIGVQDPQGAITQSLYEQWLDHIIALAMQRDRDMQQLEIQQMAQQMAQEFAAGQQAQAAGASAQAGMLEGAGGQQMPGGAGFAPPMGGQPPAMANPELTRETVKGLDFLGSPVEEMVEGLGI